MPCLQLRSYAPLKTCTTAFFFASQLAIRYRPPAATSEREYQPPSNGSRGQILGVGQQIPAEGGSLHPRALLANLSQGLLLLRPGRDVYVLDEVGVVGGGLGGGVAGAVVAGDGFAVAGGFRAAFADLDPGDREPELPGGLQGAGVILSWLPVLVGSAERRPQR